MARKKTKEEKEYGVLLANVREVSQSSAGKELIWHILSLCDIYSDAYGGPTETVLHLSGKRAVGLSILQLLDDADLSIYPRLLLEKRKIEFEGGQNDRTDSNDSDTGTDGADIESDTGIISV